MSNLLEEEDGGDNVVRDVEDASGLGARPERGLRESFIPMPGGRSESEGRFCGSSIWRTLRGTGNNGGRGSATLKYQGRKGPLRDDTPLGVEHLLSRSLSFPPSYVVFGQFGSTSPHLI